MANTGRSSRSHTPPSLIYMLVSLSDGELTRQQIEQRVAEYSHGCCQLSQVNAHRRIKFMMRSGWIEAAPGLRSHSEARRTIYYRLLAAGRHTLEEEIKRLQAVIALGKRQLNSHGSGHRGRQSSMIGFSDPNHYGHQETKQQKEEGKRRGREKTLSIDAASALLHLPRTVITRMIAAGILKATASTTKTSQRRWNIAADSVTRVMWQQGATGEQASDHNRKKQHYSRGLAVLSIKEASRYASVTRNTIKTWLRTGKLEVANPELRGRPGMKVTLNSLRKILKPPKRKKGMPELW